MFSKKSRYTRGSFPRGRAQQRSALSWGDVSFYPSPVLRGAVVVSKKILPKAHDRNRLKRRVREALSIAVAESSHVAGVLVFPRSEALTVPLTKLASDLKEAIKTVSASPR